MFKKDRLWLPITPGYRHDRLTDHLLSVLEIGLACIAYVCSMFIDDAQIRFFVRVINKAMVQRSVMILNTSCSMRLKFPWCRLCSHILLRNKHKATTNCIIVFVNMCQLGLCFFRTEDTEKRSRTKRVNILYVVLERIFFPIYLS